MEREEDRWTSSADYEANGEVISDIAGHLEISRDHIEGDPHLMIKDRRRLKGHVKKVIDGFHKADKEVWVRVTAHKTLILTVVSTAAFASGMVGIGARIRRKGERKK